MSKVKFTETVGFENRPQLRIEADEPGNNSHPFLIEVDPNTKETYLGCFRGGAVYLSKKDVAKVTDFLTKHLGD